MGSKKTSQDTALLRHDETLAEREKDEKHSHRAHTVIHSFFFITARLPSSLVAVSTYTIIINCCPSQQGCSMPLAVGRPSLSVSGFVECVMASLGSSIGVGIGTWY